MAANKNHSVNKNEIQQSEQRVRKHTSVLVILLLISIPILMLLWLGNGTLVVVPVNHNESIAPTRWLVAVLISSFVAYWGLIKRSVNLNGAIVGFVVGFIITLSSYIFSVCLLVFFVASTKATNFRKDVKRRFEEEYKEGGQRGWVQVICNSAMAVQVTLLYILDTGCGERPINFIEDYRESWFGLALLGTFACCNGDTFGSELGTVVGSESVYLITTLKKVPRGTNGGVTQLGLLLTFLGGLVIGLAYYIALICTIDSLVLYQSPPQWPVILWGGFAGLVGGLFDSLFGAVFEYSGRSYRYTYNTSSPIPQVTYQYTILFINKLEVENSKM